MVITSMIADVAMESEASSLDETSQDALAREELMLQRKAVMLEEFLRTSKFLIAVLDEK
jgi:hypothetical protein